MKKEFEKYMTTYRLGWMILSGIFLGLLIMFIVCFFLGMDVKPIGLPIFGGGFLLTLIPLWKSRKFFKILEDSNQMDMVLQDFSAATPMRKDQIRFGQRWIFCKGKAFMIPYERVHQVYQYIHKTNFVEDERWLKCVDDQGKTRKLCRLDLRGKSDAELQSMIRLIWSKNPGVKIGYQ